MNITEIMQKRYDLCCVNYRAVSGRGTNALNFEHIFHLRWESDQKLELLKKRHTLKMESLY